MIPAIVWNRELYLAFRLAYEAADGAGFRFCFNPPKNRWSRPAVQSYVTAKEAHRKLAELEADFLPADIPALPYLEGKEGQ